VVTWIAFLAGLIGLQRLLELALAGCNRQWMLVQGAQEFGAGHYPLFFIAAQGLRYWCIVEETTGKIIDETHKIMSGEKETLAGLYNSVRPEMNEDILKGQWHELKGGIKAKWRKLTDDDLTMVNGESEELMGILQTRYGYSKDKAKEEYDNFTNSIKK